MTIRQNSNLRYRPMQI